MGDIYDRLIAIEIDGEWFPIESAAQSLEFLRKQWPERTGPSYLRAVSSCEAFLAGDGTMLGARAAFAVAAMEAGMQFELYDDLLTFTEARVACVAADEVRKSYGREPTELDEDADGFA